MNRFVLCLIAAAAATVASAAPVSCAAPTPSDVSSPAFSYTCGGLTFSGFAVTNTGNQPVGQVNIGNSSYEDFGGTRTVTLNLNPNLSLGPSNPPQAADIWLWYTVTGGINFRLDQVGGVMPQSGAYTETVCSSPFAGVVCPGTQLDQFTVWGPSNTTVWGSNSNMNTFTAYVFKDIGGPSPINTTALAQIFRTTGPLGDIPPAAVPEPASMMLMGTGLIAAAVFGRRVVKVKA